MMPHRDEAEALRARIATLEDERDALAERNAELESALAASATRAADLEAQLGRAQHDVVRGVRRAKDAADEALRDAREETARAWRVASTSVAAPPAATESEPDRPADAPIDDGTFARRTPEKRLRDALHFADEGRGREALQIVLSVYRMAPRAGAREVLSLRVRCARCGTQVTPPDDVDSEDYAHFFGGRCPTCRRPLELAAVGR